MNHLHFVVKRNSRHHHHHHHGKNQIYRNDNQCPEPAHPNSTLSPKCTHGSGNIDNHSNQTLDLFNQGSSHFCFPVKFPNEKRKNRSENRYQSCSQQAPNHRRSCKRKSWTTDNSMQCKPHRPPQEGHSRSQVIREQRKSHPSKKKVENTERELWEEKIHQDGVENVGGENPKKTHERCPSLSSNGTNLSGNGKNMPNKMKLKKLYENESIMKHETRGHSNNSMRRRSRRRKCRRQHDLQSNQCPSNSSLDKSGNQSRSNREAIEKRSSEPFPVSKETRLSTKKKGEGNNRLQQGKKIAFAEKESYRTFNSHEPPSKIGAPKTKNLPRSAAQNSNGDLSEADDDIANVPTDKIADENGVGDRCDSSAIESFSSTSSMHSRKSSKSEELVSPETKETEQSTNLPSPKNYSMQSVSYKTPYGSRNSLHSSKAFSCRTASPMPLRNVTGSSMNRKSHYYARNLKEDFGSPNFQTSSYRNSIGTGSSVDEEDYIWKYRSFTPLNSYNNMTPSTCYRRPMSSSSRDYSAASNPLGGFSALAVAPQVYNTDRASMSSNTSNYYRSFQPTKSYKSSAPSSTPYRRPMSKSYTYNSNQRPELDPISVYQTGSYPEGRMKGFTSSKTYESFSPSTSYQNPESMITRHGARGTNFPYNSFSKQFWAY